MGKHIKSFGKFQLGILRMKRKKKERVEIKDWKQKQEEGQPVNPDLSMPNYRELG